MHENFREGFEKKAAGFEKEAVGGIIRGAGKLTRRVLAVPTYVKGHWTGAKDISDLGSAARKRQFLKEKANIEAEKSLARQEDDFAKSMAGGKGKGKSKGGGDQNQNQNQNQNQGKGQKGNRHGLVGSAKSEWRKMSPEGKLVSGVGATYLAGKGIDAAGKDKPTVNRYG